MGISVCLSSPHQKLLFTNSIVSFFVFAGLTFFFHQVFGTLLGLPTSGRGRGKIPSFPKGEGRQWLIAGFFSFLFAVCMAFGGALEKQEHVVFTQGGMWLAIVLGGIFLTFVVVLAWQVLGNLAVSRAEVSSRQEREGDQEHTTGIPLWLMSRAALIFLCWLPVFLGVYPGFFVYDAQEEWVQVATREFTAHHPLIHVLLLGGIIQAVHKLTDSYNLGIACYTLLQMGVLSFVFAAALLFLQKRRVSFGVGLGILLYFGFFPVIVMFSLCSAKDGLFTGMILLLFLMLQELCSRPERFFSSKGYQILFVLSGAGMMLFRHNGKYAFGIMAVILLFYCRNHRKRVLALTAAGMALFLLGSSGLGILFHAEKGGVQEMLTVPIQQMARVYQSEKEEMTSKEREALYEFIPKEALERYVPKVSDGVKIDFNKEAFGENPMKFLRLWGKWGLEHPFTYLNGWFMTSYGFWYPDTIIDVYRGNTVFTYTYQDSSYFGYEVEPPGTRESKIPWLAEGYRRLSLEVTQQKIPVISMLFSPGFLFWVMLFTIGYVWVKREYGQLIPYLLPLLIWLTVILGPTCLVRYVVFLWALFPFMLLTLTSGSAGLLRQNPSP